LAAPQLTSEVPDSLFSYCKRSALGLFGSGNETTPLPVSLLLWPSTRTHTGLPARFSCLVVSSRSQQIASWTLGPPAWQFTASRRPDRSFLCLPRNL